MRQNYQFATSQKLYLGKAPKIGCTFKILFIGSKRVILRVLSSIFPNYQSCFNRILKKISVTLCNIVFQTKKADNGDMKVISAIFQSHLSF